MTVLRCGHPHRSLLLPSLLRWRVVVGERGERDELGGGSLEVRGGDGEVGDGNVLAGMEDEGRGERATIDLKQVGGGELREGSKGVKVWFRFEAELEKSMHGYYKSEGDADETGKKPVCEYSRERLSSGGSFELSESVAGYQRCENDHVVKNTHTGFFPVSSASPSLL
jgi:hypothetical protein